MTVRKRTIRAGAAQLPATTLDQAVHALELIHDAIDRAAGQGVQLLVLPEGAYPSYFLPSVEAYRSARVLPNNRFLGMLGDRARRHGMHLVCGFVEDRGDCLHNAAALIDDAGTVIGIARKSFLWGDDNKVFAPGRELRAFACKLGAVGIAICADVRAPETTAALAWRGAQIIAIPTCWVNTAREPGAYYNPQPDFLIEARSREIAVPFVCANKFGRETDSLSYCGYSLITDAQGHVLAKASPDQATILTADIQAARARKPALPDWARDRIVCTQPAEEPDIGPDGTVRVAAVPTTRIMPGDDDHDVLRSLAAEGVQVVALALPSAKIAEEMEVYARSLGIELIGRAGDSRVLCGSFGSYGALRGSEMLSFAPARALALDGAAILFVTDPPDDLVVLRARAAENKVFVVGTSARSALIIAPNGAILARSADSDSQPVIAMVDLESTRDKYVFPGTHIFEQRKPHLYGEAFR